MEFNSKLMNELSDIFSPAGREKNICEYIKNIVKDYVDEVTVDAMGNLIAHKKGPGKKIMFSAHMDQIGMMVTGIDEKGFIKFCNVGGIPPYKIIDQRIVFNNGVQGFVGVEKVDSYAGLKLSNLYVDIMATSKEDAEKHVSVGDMFVTKTSYYENENCVMCNALDDRIGCYVLIEALRNGINSENDLYFVFSTQEEVGLRGAKTAAYGIDPDLGIALDVTATGDDLDGIKMDVKLHGGACIKIKDSASITPVEVVDLMTDLAKENDIKYQYEVLEFGGTDAGAMQLTKSGVLSGTVSVASRNIHSGNEVVSKSDVIECVKLTMAIANKKQ